MPEEPQPSLHDRLIAIFGELRRTDATIARFNRAIEAKKRQIANYENLIAVARVGIRSRERGLMKAAYVLLRKETGILRFPGFRTPMEEADAFRKGVAEKLKAATDAASGQSNNL